MEIASKCFGSPSHHWFWRRSNASFYLFLHRDDDKYPFDLTNCIKDPITLADMNLWLIGCQSLQIMLDNTRNCQKGAVYFVCSPNALEYEYEAKQNENLLQIPKLDFHLVEVAFCEKYGSKALIERLSKNAEDTHYSQQLHWYIEEQGLGSEWIGFSDEKRQELFLKWLENNPLWAMSAGMDEALLQEEIELYINPSKKVETRICGFSVPSD